MKKINRTVCLLLSVLALFSALCAPVLAAEAEQSNGGAPQSVNAADEQPAAGDGTAGFIAAAAFFLFAFGFAIIRIKKADGKA